MAYSVFRVPNSITILPATGTSVVATVQGASGQSVDLQQWLDYQGNIISRIDNAGNHSGVAGTFSGNVAVNGGSLTTTQTTANLFNSSATSLNIGQASTTTNLGAGNGTVNIGGTTAVNTLTATGTINANGGTLATNQTTFNLLNTNATTINFGAAATTINIGASNSNTVINGNLLINGTTTTINTTEIATADFYMHLGSGATTTAALNNAGLVLGSGIAGTGLGVKLTYNTANGASWTSTENLNVASTKSYQINGVNVLSATSLGNNVLTSYLTGVGTIATGVWNGTVIGTGYTQAQVVAVSGTATRTVIGGTAAWPVVDLATVTQGSTGTSFVKVGIDGYGRVINNTAVTSGDIPNLSAAQITAGTLAVAQGGTNLSSYTTGDILYANGTTSIGKLSAVASGQFLVSNGTSTVPFYRFLTTPDITGALGYTPASAASGITGTGVSGKVALWSSLNSQTYDTDLGYDSTNNILSIGYGNLNGANADVTVNTSLQTIDTFASGTYRSAKYLIQTKNGTTHQVSEALVIHDGINAYLTEYGQIYTSGTTPLITLSVATSAPNIVLQAVGSSAGNTVRFFRTTLNV